MLRLPEGEYAVYLRKSRKDIEEESRTGLDTLQTHRRALFDLARRLNISITEEYPEVVSGERISARPEMQRLLSDVDNGRWKGVLVMEVERLARGDTMDQGIVAQAFKYSNTLIITPTKIFDPTDPNDEEYFEFGLFMSRREFKTITRRLQWGRDNAVRMGRYPGNVAPYGYKRKKLTGKGYTLEPHPDEAPIVKLIFELYTEKNLGTPSIADYLNELGIPSRKKTGWSMPTIRDIIRNPVYIGYVRWGRRKAIKKRDGTIERPRQKEWTQEKGLHPAILDEETFYKAQKIMDDNARPPVEVKKITNPLAGLIRCGLCGGPIIYRSYTKSNIKPQLICTNKQCACKGSKFHLVEDRLVKALRDWLKQYKAEWRRGMPKNESNSNTKELVVKTIQNELEELQKQKGNLHDLVERGVYTVETFLERSQALSQRIAKTIEVLNRAQAELDQEHARKKAMVNVIPNVDHVLKVYPKAQDPAEKNELLRSVLEKVEYVKTHGGRWSGAEDTFTLRLYPKLPR